MPTFEYQAVGNDGATVNGVAVGATLDQTMAELAQKGIQVTRIGESGSAFDPILGRSVSQPRAERPTVELPGAEGLPPELGPRNYWQTSVWGPLVGQVPLTAQLFFYRQLATMMKAGVPYGQSLHTLARQARNPKLRGIIQELAGHVEEGRPISFGMQRYPEVFSPVIISLIRAGEHGGMLEDALATVGDYTEREIDLRSLYRRVTFYPKLQIGASIIIIVGANLIIATVAPGAKGLNSPLTEPATWIVLGPLIVAIFLFLRVGLANYRIKSLWDMFVLHIPYIGTTIRQLTMAKFGRAFGALYKGGVPITESIRLAADACGNEHMRARIYPAAARLEEGEGIGRTLTETGVFSPIVLDMVNTGETTGNLDQMLNRVADFYEQEGETRSKQTGQVIGVLVALLVAVYIGYVVISFYVGYFSGIQEAVK